MRPPTSVSSRTDNRGNTGAQCFAQNKPKVSFYSLARPAGVSGAQIIWARIRATPIAAYKVGSLLHCAGEALLPKSGTKISGGGNSFDLFSQLVLTAFHVRDCRRQCRPGFRSAPQHNKNLI